MVPVDANYNPFKQVSKNAIRKKTREYWPGLLVAGLVTLTLLFFSLRWVRRRLRP